MALGITIGISNFPGFLKANFFLMRNTQTLHSFFEKNDLPDIEIDLSLKSYNKINSKREEALVLNRLITSDSDFVNAKIKYQGKATKVKIRLKGDLADHWDSEKFSFRVEVKGGHSFMGMTRFSLQQPGTRGDTSQWLFLQNLRKEDLLAVKFEFINLKINGKDMGVYALEEHFTKELLETQKRREGVIISFDEHRFWSKFPPSQSNLSWNAVYQTSDLNVRNTKQVESSPTLSKQKEIALNLLRGFQENKLQGEQVFDTAKLGKFLAICRIWNAEHALLLHNINFYLNPITCLLEPIGFDAMPGINKQSPWCYFTEGRLPVNWVNQALKSSEIAESYIKNLWAYSSETYLVNLQESFESSELHYRRLLLHNLIMSSDSDIWSSNYSLLNYDVWNMLKERFSLIRNELAEKKPILAYSNLSHENPLAIDLHIRNALTQPVEIVSFHRGDKQWNPKNVIASSLAPPPSLFRGKIILPNQNFGNNLLMNDHIFSLALNETIEKNHSPLQIKCRILGVEKIVEIEVPIPYFPFQVESLPLSKTEYAIYDKYEFISKKGDNILISKGTHFIQEDLIFPPAHKIIIDKGTKLLFSQNACLISRSPIQAKGTQDAPIVFTATDEYWPGILVTNTVHRSHFEHVTFQNVTGVGTLVNAKGIERDGWVTTGGLTFHYSPVEIIKCKFEGSYAEDALNIFSSSFAINKTLFINVVSDAFDGDFVDGNVTECIFNHIGGDAIDFSGSNALISQTSISNVKDKGLSAGEGSIVNFRNSSLHNVNFGIASKDKSLVTAENIIITNAKTAGLAAYQKKNTFGPAEIITTNESISQTDTKFMVQLGSRIISNGNEIKQVSFNAKSLYD